MQRRFKEFVLEEGDVWDALCHSFSTGFKAYREKRDQQKNTTEQQKLTQKLFSAEGKELSAIIRQIVEKGYTVQQGQVINRPTRWKTKHQEMLEQRRPA